MKPIISKNDGAIVLRSVISRRPNTLLPAIIGMESVNWTISATGGVMSFQTNPGVTLNHISPARDTFAPLEMIAMLSTLLMLNGSMAVVKEKRNDENIMDGAHLGVTR